MNTFGLPFASHLGVLAVAGQATKTTIIAGLVLLAVATVIYLFVAWRVVQERVDEKIGGEIRAMGGTIDQVVVPARFDTGPFEAVSFERGSVFRLAIEMCFYRKVHWRDQESQPMLSWAEVTAWVTFRQIREITWKHDVDLDR